MSELTLERIRAAMAQLPKRTPPQAFIMNIDDVVGFARMMRQGGFLLRRGRTLTGEKAAYFHVYARTPYGLQLPNGTIYVDRWRVTPRGKILAFDPSPPKWKPPYWSGR